MNVKSTALRAPAKEFHAAVGFVIVIVIVIAAPYGVEPLTGALPRGRLWDGKRLQPHTHQTESGQEQNDRGSAVQTGKHVRAKAG